MRLIGCARGCSGEKEDVNVDDDSKRGNLDITVFISAVIAPGALLLLVPFCFYPSSIRFGTLRSLLDDLL